ncbi:VOC family protein [Nocardia sp. NPDC019395]|uniref:VOC family protein n=1 Tax=Nocardia sp. NPDC019395 TaxID=3154686 RepID=UPI0034026FBC
MGSVVHHTAVRVSDLEKSLLFYRDGLGMQVTVQGEFRGPWRHLFDAPGDTMEMIMLGDPASPHAGTIELVRIPGAADSSESAGPQGTGLLLISLYCDVDSTLARLARLGFGDGKRGEVSTDGITVVMATVRDPDGVLVELVDQTTGAQITG